MFNSLIRLISILFLNKNWKKKKFQKNEKLRKKNSKKLRIIEKYDNFSMFNRGYSWNVVKFQEQKLIRKTKTLLCSKWNWKNCEKNIFCELNANARRQWSSEEWNNYPKTERKVKKIANWNKKILTLVIAIVFVQVKKKLKRFFCKRQNIKIYKCNPCSFKRRFKQSTKAYFFSKLNWKRKKNQ